MWNVVDEGSYKLYVNKKINLKIKIYKEGEAWDIHERMRGDPAKNPEDIYFVIDSLCLRAFIDLIYFFIIENSVDQMLRKEYQVNW